MIVQKIQNSYLLTHNPSLCDGQTEPYVLVPMKSAMLNDCLHFLVSVLFFSLLKPLLTALEDMAFSLKRVLVAHLAIAFALRQWLLLSSLLTFMFTLLELKALEKVLGC